MATRKEERYCLKEVKITGDQGEFTVYLSDSDIKNLDDQTYTEQFYQCVSKSQEIDVKLQGAEGVMMFKATPYEFEKIKSDPMYADIHYKRMVRAAPKGPLKNYIPAKYHQYISTETLNSFLASSHDDENKIRDTNPNATVLVRQFIDKVYPKVEESLNDFGKDILSSMEPWIICALIDQDNFDSVISNLPKVAENKSRPDHDHGDDISDVENEESTDIWATPRVSTPTDRRATSVLLEIVGSDIIQKKILVSDKKTKKKTVWKEVADTLSKRGFSFSPDVDSSEKVSQKFRNLEKEYRSFVENSKKTGAAKKKKPEHFDELHRLLSGKHSINPVSLSDTSVSVSPQVDVSFKVEPKEEPKEENLTPKSKKLKSTTSKTDKKEIIEVMKEMNQQALVREEKRMDILVNIQKELTKQHEERIKATYAFIDVLKK